MKLEDELRKEIYNQLKAVKKNVCPNVYRMIQTESGYMQVENMIINMVVNDHITPSACIAQIEVEL